MDVQYVRQIIKDGILSIKRGSDKVTHNSLFVYVNGGSIICRSVDADERGRDRFKEQLEAVVDTIRVMW